MNVPKLTPNPELEAKHKASTTSQKTSAKKSGCIVQKQIYSLIFTEMLLLNIKMTNIGISTNL